MDDGRLAIGNIIDALEIETPHVGRCNLKVNDKPPGIEIIRLKTLPTYPLPLLLPNGGGGSRAGRGDIAFIVSTSPASSHPLSALHSHPADASPVPI